jgi:hypothetical protein
MAIPGPQPAEVITGLDIATRLTGWCVGSGADTPKAGAWQFPQVHEEYGQLIDLFDRALETHVELYRTTTFIYESPILTRTDHLQTVRKIYGMGTHLEFFARRKGIRCVEEDLRKIKLELGGSFRSGKADMVAAAEKLGIALPKTQAAGREDAADAAGAWLVGVRHYARRYQEQWDRLLYSSRGALL